MGEYKICGVLGVEHFGKQSDGFCLTLVLHALAKVDTKGGTVSGKGSSFQWTPITDDETAQRLQDAVFADFGCALFD